MFVLAAAPASLCAADVPWCSASHQRDHPLPHGRQCWDTTRYLHSSCPIARQARAALLLQGRSSDVARSDSGTAGGRERTRRGAKQGGAETGEVVRTYKTHTPILPYICRSSTHQRPITSRCSAPGDHSSAACELGGRSTTQSLIIPMSASGRLHTAAVMKPRGLHELQQGLITSCRGRDPWNYLCWWVGSFRVPESAAS